MPLKFNIWCSYFSQVHLKTKKLLKYKSFNDESISGAAEDLENF